MANANQSQPEEGRKTIAAPRSCSALWLTCIFTSKLLSLSVLLTCDQVEVIVGVVDI